jgi:uncharacterized protein with von Willebrand factor type A (vWA) domain
LGGPRHPGPGPDRLALFDALFSTAFRDLGTVPSAKSLGGEESTVAEAGVGTLDLVAAERANETGESASAAEALAVKRFAPRDDSDRLRIMRRRLARLAPHRRGHRHVTDVSGTQLDLRRSLARMVRAGALDSALAWTARQQIPRRVLLLIDISGSMKSHTENHMRFAHAVTQALPFVETFAFGTRLTRLTKALGSKDIARALDAVAPAVADWDGGTRIADSIGAFLSARRYSRSSRGALILVLSDGLERGNAALVVRAVRRLAARSWRLAWLTPLAAAPDFRPETEALAAILGIVDHLGDGSGIAALSDFIETSARLGLKRPAPGRSGDSTYGNSSHRRASSYLAAG